MTKSASCRECGQKRCIASDTWVVCSNCGKKLHVLEFLEDLARENEELVEELEIQHTKYRNLKSRNKIKLEREIEVLMQKTAENDRLQQLGLISAQISHDLSNPLQVLLGCVDNLMRNPDRINDQKYIQRIAKSTKMIQHLTSTINSKLKNDTDSNKETNTSSFIETHNKVFELLRLQFRFLPRETFDIQPKVYDLELKIPSVDLLHILNNLYTNSLKNIFDNGIANPKICIGIAKKGKGKVQLEIADNGTGLTKSKFIELTSLDAYDRTRQVYNNGLGLRLIKKLTKTAEGDLTVADHSGRNGTAYLLTLKQAKSIWIVDSCPSLRLFYSNWLGYTYNLKVFASISDFKRSLKNVLNLPSLIVAEPTLPDGSFLKFLKLSRSKKLENIPVLMTSAENNLNTIRSAIKLGVADYLTKPFDSDQIKEKVRYIINYNSPHSDLYISEDVVARLSRKQRKILSFLLSRKRATVEEIIDAVWGPVLVSNKTFDVYMYNLRRKLHDEGLLIRSDSSGYFTITPFDE